MENNTIKQNLKATFTAYWHFLALQKACQCKLFDILQEEKELSLIELVKRLKLSFKPLYHLLSFLTEENYLIKHKNTFSLTEKGAYLCENHPDSLKNACLLWGQEHLTAWQHLEYTLQTAQPSFEYIFKMSFFDYIKNNKAKLENYHRAMQEYAMDDYKNLPLRIDFSTHKCIADIGGGLGTLLHLVLHKYPQTQAILFDLPEVVNLINKPKEEPFDIIGGSFFEPLHFQTDALILSRVLHDWEDEKALKILTHCKNALKPRGTLYILEILQNDTQAHLLSLNMLAICKSYERTLEEYQILLKKAEFNIKAIYPLNNLQKIIVCQ